MHWRAHLIVGQKCSAWNGPQELARARLCARMAVGAKVSVRCVCLFLRLWVSRRSVRGSVSANLALSYTRGVSVDRGRDDPPVELEVHTAILAAILDAQKCHGVVGDTPNHARLAAALL